MAYKLRIGGTNDFVSVIDPWDKRSYPPGRVDVVSGWDNPSAIIFDSLEAAHKAADKVADIEGFHTSVEKHISAEEINNVGRSMVGGL